MLDFLHKRSTINEVYHANFLDQLRIGIREKRRGKLSNGVLLQQDNARVHTCEVAMDSVERNAYEFNTTSYLFAFPSSYRLFPVPRLQISMDVISGLTKKSCRQLKIGSRERTLAFSVLGRWHLNTVGLSALHQRAISSKKKRRISTGNKLGRLLIDSPS